MTVTREAPARLCLPPLLETGVALRQAVSTVLAALGASREEASDVVLAVNEAFNNAICHGRMGRSDQVHVTMEIAAEELIITLEYRGDPFPVVPPALPEPTNPHGRGRYLMELLTDAVSYQFYEGWTRTELRKRIR